MTIKSSIQAALQRMDRLCDDCLSEVTGINPRQAINKNAREMSASKVVSRATEDCARCKRVKIINRLGAASAVANASLSASVTSKESVDRPWYWEGNVQRKIVEFLRANGHAIDSEADTASRRQGKDIVARTPQGRLLWVTVKGFPERSKNVQARHWFAGALHDLTRYRDEDQDALLAMGLPRGFSTYEGLIGRNIAVRRFLGYRVFWVQPDGAVSVDELG